MYYIGQFRHSSQVSYSDDMQIEELTTQESEGQVAFLDVCANLTGNYKLNSNNCYYLKFTVKQDKTYEQKFYLKLRNRANLTEKEEQLIEEYKVDKGIGTASFEVIISPNATYDQILWELQRTTSDYYMPRVMDVTVQSGDFTKLQDIMTELKNSYSNLNYLTKIGVQSRPMLLMCINREPIRVGKSGIYEINNGVNVTSISFVPKKISPNSQDLEYFIMDFEYSVNEGG